MRVLSTKVKIYKHTHIQHLLLSLVDTRKYTHQDVVVYREKYQEIRERFFFCYFENQQNTSICETHRYTSLMRDAHKQCDKGNATVEASS